MDTIFAQNYRDISEWREENICNKLNLGPVLYLVKIIMKFNYLH